MYIKCVRMVISERDGESDAQAYESDESVAACIRERSSRRVFDDT